MILNRLKTRCIERQGALIQGINRTQPVMMTSLDVYDYYDVWKWRNRLILGLNVAENTNYMKKSFKLKLFRIKFPTNKSVGAYVYLATEWR